MTRKRLRLRVLFVAPWYGCYFRVSNVLSIAWQPMQTVSFGGREGLTTPCGLSRINIATEIFGQSDTELYRPAVLTQDFSGTSLPYLQAEDIFVFWTELMLDVMLQLICFSSSYSWQTHSFPTTQETAFSQFIQMVCFHLLKRQKYIKRQTKVEWNDVVTCFWNNMYKVIKNLLVFSC